MGTRRLGNARTVRIAGALVGRTVAAALREADRALSWTEAKGLVRARRVTVNAALCVDDARRLAAGDVLRVHEDAQTPPPREHDVRIVHLDPHLVVIDKPPAITTTRHAEERDWDPRRRDRAPTLDEVVQRLVAARLREPPAERPRAARRPHPGKPPRVRPVHRLDRDTSGLMVFALSQPAETALISMFKRHAVRRRYRAVVHGVIDGARTIDSRFVRDRGDGLRGSLPPGADAPEAQRAVTRITPVERLGDAYSVVDVELETGRTHQIRIHLAESGHMLCGERVYVRPAPGAPAVPDRSGAPRQALHSAELAMEHPVSGKALRFESPPPRDLAAWLATLRRNAAGRGRG